MPAEAAYTASPGWYSNVLPLDKRVITLCKILDKTKVARFLIAMVVASPCFGVIVGRCAGSTQAGLAVSFGIFALASFLQELTAWTLG